MRAVIVFDDQMGADEVGVQVKEDLGWFIQFS